MIRKVPFCFPFASFVVRTQVLVQRWCQCPEKFQMPRAALFRWGQLSNSTGFSVATELIDWGSPRSCRRRGINGTVCLRDSLAHP